MSKNTSITLGNHFEDFVQSRISVGGTKMQVRLFVQA